jgi:hypothetical protein
MTEPAVLPLPGPLPAVSVCDPGRARQYRARNGEDRASRPWPRRSIHALGLTIRTARGPATPARNDGQGGDAPGLASSYGLGAV